MIHKLFLILLAIVFSGSANAQYLFNTPAISSVELTVAQISAFKKVFDAQNETISKNKIKRITTENSRGTVSYTYDNKGRPLSFSLMGGGEGQMTECAYDAAGNLSQFKSITIYDGKTEEFVIDYKYNSQGNVSEALLNKEIFFSPARKYVVSYNESNIPVSISSFDVNNNPVNTSTIETNSEGKITSVKNEKGKNIVTIIYSDEGISVDYLVDFPEMYVIKNNRIEKYYDSLVSNEFTFDADGVPSGVTVTGKDDEKSDKYSYKKEKY